MAWGGGWWRACRPMVAKDAQIERRPREVRREKEKQREDRGPLRRRKEKGVWLCDLPYGKLIVALFKKTIHYFENP